MGGDEKRVLSPSGFGWLTELSKDADMSTQGVFLGIEEEFTALPTDGSVSLEPKASFLEKVRSALDGAPSSNTLQPAGARVLAGLLVRVSTCSAHFLRQGPVEPLALARTHREPGDFTGTSMPVAEAPYGLRTPPYYSTRQEAAEAFYYLY